MSRTSLQYTARGCERTREEEAERGRMAERKETTVKSVPNLDKRGNTNAEILIIRLLFKPHGSFHTPENSLLLCFPQPGPTDPNNPK